MLYIDLSMKHTCSVLVLSCIDFRFQSSIRNFLIGIGLENDYDLLTRPGSSKDIDEALIGNIGLSLRLHGIKKVLVIHHQNCGAYGESLISGSGDELNKHKSDMQTNTKILKDKFPEMEFETYFANLLGEIVKV